MNSNKNIDIKKTTFLEWFLIGSLMTLFLIKIYPVYFAVDDDILTYTIVRHGDLFRWAVHLTKSGRITQFMSTLMLGIPMMADQLWIYKLFSYGTILFDVYVLYRLVSDFIDKDIAKTVITLFWGLAVISNWHSLFLAYVFSHQIIIGLILCSIYFYLQYLQKPQCKKKLLWSSIFYMFSIIIYESAVAYILLFVIISLFYEKNMKRAVLSMSYHISVVLVFLFVYFAWRKIYPITYDGASFFFGDPVGSIWCLFMYSIAAFPLIPMLYTIYNGELITFFLQASYDIYLIAGLTTFLFGYFIKRIIWKGKYLKIIIISIMGMFLPNLPLCVTSKYINWCNEKTFGYLTSFYSWFFMVLAGVLCAVWICSLFHYKRTIRMFLCSCVFAISLATGAFNSGIGNMLKVQTERYIAFNNLMSSGAIQNFDDGTNIYMPEYHCINNSEEYMQYYAKLYTDKDLFFTNDYEQLDFGHPVVEFRYNPGEGCVEYNYLTR